MLSWQRVVLALGFGALGIGAALIHNDMLAMALVTAGATSIPATMTLGKNGGNGNGS